jgi:hypothetical protein
MSSTVLTAPCAPRMASPPRTKEGQVTIACSNARRDDISSPAPSSPPPTVQIHVVMGHPMGTHYPHGVAGLRGIVRPVTRW